MPTIAHKFNSLSDFSDFISNNEINGYFAKHYLNSSEYASESFTGTKTFEDANNLMLGGWAEGAARVQKFMNASRPTMPKKQIYNSVVGFAPNVPAYLQGLPLNMFNQRKINTPKKVVTICYNCTVSWKIDASDIEKTAAKLFNVVSGLEASGVRVELWVLNLGRNAKIIGKGKNQKGRPGNEYNYMAVKIKSAAQPFNLLKMVYPCVHPSFLRRHGFAYQERAGLQGEPGGYGWDNYGVGCSDYKAACAALGLSSDNVFSYYTLCDKSEKEIAKMIH